MIRLIFGSNHILISTVKRVLQKNFWEEMNNQKINVSRSLKEQVSCDDNVFTQIRKQVKTHIWLEVWLQVRNKIKLFPELKVGISTRGNDPTKETK